MNNVNTSVSLKTDLTSQNITGIEQHHKLQSYENINILPNALHKIWRALEGFERQFRLLHPVSDIDKRMIMIKKFIIKIFTLPIRLYQILISPLLGKNCRFTPTCSQYMIEAIQIWGPCKGIYLGIKRISKCHPWGPHGEDPVPQKKRKSNVSHKNYSSGYDPLTKENRRKSTIPINR